MSDEISAVLKLGSFYDLILDCMSDAHVHCCSYIVRVVLAVCLNHRGQSSGVPPETCVDEGTLLEFRAQFYNRHYNALQ